MELIATIATAVCFAGVFLIARKNIIGQVLMVICQCFWLTYAYLTGQVALGVQSAVLFFIALYAVWYWQKYRYK